MVNRRNSGQPEPVGETDALDAVAFAAGVLVVGGLLVAAVAPMLIKTKGATRTAELEWQRREQVIEAAIQEKELSNDRH